MKILYVEDNEDNIYMLKSRLTRAGYTVLVATDGAQGVAMATSERPDLVLMDLSLPVLDGWEAARRIKAAPETSGIPIIALTAHVMPGDQEKALAAGCDDFDTKPVELSRLLGKIRALAVTPNKRSVKRTAPVVSKPTANPKSNQPTSAGKSARIPSAVHCGIWPARSGRRMTFSEPQIGSPKAAAVIARSAAAPSPPIGRGKASA